MKSTVLLLILVAIGTAVAASNPFVMWPTEVYGSTGKGPVEDKTSDIIAKQARNIAYASAFFSALALLLSFLQFHYQKNKDRADRRHSIEDEFWFREVLCPATIEPLMGHVQHTCSSLPERSAFDDLNIKDGYAAYARQYQKNHSEIISQLMILSMFDASVYSKASQKIDEIEDIVMEHCNANSTSTTGLDAGGKPMAFFERSEAVRQIHGKLTEALKILRETHRELF